MLSLGSPGFFYAALVAAVGVVALHFLAWRRPRPVLLPTARFVDASPMRAVSRDVRLSDAALMIVRVLAVLLLGLALSAPRLAPARRGEAWLVVADRSRAVASLDEIRDSVASLGVGSAAARIVWFDSTPSLPTDLTANAASGVTRVDGRGNLDAAMVTAIREGSRLARTHERVHLVVVSPVVREEAGAALALLGAQWGDSIRLMRVAARRDVDSVAALGEGRLPPVEDAVGATMRLALGDARSARSGRSTVGAGASNHPNAAGVSPPQASAARSQQSPRVRPASGMVAGDEVMVRTPAVAAVRGSLSREDSVFAKNGGVVLAWPVVPISRDSATHVFSITTAQHTFVGDFVRGELPSTGSAIAWGADGEILAREAQLGRGCLRSLAFAPNERGDVALRTGFVAIVRDLVGPCDGVDWRPASAATIEGLTRPTARPHTTAIAPDDVPSNVARWLLLGVFGLLAAEWWLRRSRASATAMHAGDSAGSAREAAA